MKKRACRLNTLATAIFKFWYVLCFVFANYNTTFLLFIANEKINKEQLWTAVILSNKWKALKNEFFFTRLRVISKRKKCIIRTVLNDQLYICNKDILILYLWSLWWRVLWKFVFSFSSEKKFCFKIQEINKRTQTKFLFSKKGYLNR